MKIVYSFHCKALTRICSLSQLLSYIFFFPWSELGQILSSSKNKKKDKKHHKSTTKLAYDL